MPNVQMTKDARLAESGAAILPLVSIAIGLGAVNLAGLNYYLMAQADRVRDPWHAWFKPTGFVGQTAGIVGFALFVSLYLYPLRKRWRALAFLGAIGRWLDVHIVIGLSVPVIVAIHAGWRFEGLIGLGFWAMLLVSLSGVVGKYLYTRIPRRRGGLELTLAEVERSQASLAARIAEVTGIDGDQVARDLVAHVSDRPSRGIASAFFNLIASDFSRLFAARQLRRKWSGLCGRERVDSKAIREAVRLARRQIAIAQRVGMLDATHRVFSFWHVAHRPLSITAIICVAIHVVVALTLGVTWFG